jgi:voltage-gated potassium channel
MLDNPPIHNLIICHYFAFTTLTTVGLGDYHPITNLERLVTVSMFLGGLITLSFITGNFMKVVGRLQEV